MKSQSGLTTTITDTLDDVFDKMVLWKDRHVIYKISFCGLVLSTVAYVFGFSLPYWSLLRLRNYGYVDQTVGLWQACIHKSLTCVSNVHASNPCK